MTSKRTPSAVMAVVGRAISDSNIEGGAAAYNALAALIEVAREVQADMGYLMGRASLEGHEAGQRLAKQTSAKLRAALNAVQP